MTAKIKPLFVGSRVASILSGVSIHTTGREVRAGTLPLVPSERSRRRRIAVAHLEARAGRLITIEEIETAQAIARQQIDREGAVKRAKKTKQEPASDHPSGTAQQNEGASGERDSGCN